MLAKFSDIKCEKQLLGAILENPERIIDSLVNGSDFYYSLHAEIYDLISEKVDSGEKFTIYDIRSYFKGRKITDTQTFDEYIEELIEEIIVPNIYEHSRVIKELAYKRRLHVYLSDGIKRLDNNEFPEEIIEGLKDIHAEKEVLKIKTEEDVSKEILDALRNNVDCYSTGIKLLDDAMQGGLYEKYVYGFAGAEKSGKTTLAHTISHNLDCKHLYVAMEMDAKQINQRNIARDLDTNSLNFINDRRKELIPKIEKYKPKGNKLFLDAAGWSWSEIRSEILKAKVKYGIKGFVIDYLQIIDDVENPKRGETEEKAMRRVAQHIANLCRHTGLFCILLAQRGKGGALFGGNGLRKACDQLYFIEQPEREKTVKERWNRRWLRMDASRYTLMNDIGSEENMPFFISKIGPYFSEDD